MARYQVILAYDGTEFSGFQRQSSKREIRTVQAEVENALRKIGWQDDTILAAARTDAGVHADGQVISFDLDWKHSEPDLLAALNANLPEDVAARRVLAVGSNFHPRYDAVARTYCYRIYCQPLRNPLRERYAWRIWPELDYFLLEKASALLLGEHDFGAFGSPFHSSGSTRRRVSQAGWRKKDDSLDFVISANAFLYRMVRRLVSFQVQIGYGAVDLISLKGCLNAGRQQMVQGLAPANGLILDSVTYPNQVSTEVSHLE